MSVHIKRNDIAKVILWTGEPNRKLTLKRPCECGCDEREGPAGVGYLIVSDGDGNGVTLWIEHEDVYQVLQRVLG